MPQQQIIGRYQLIEMIGQGGMGKVYRAVDRLNGAQIALKRLHDDHGFEHPTRGAALSLAREFQTIASLWHPNIIRVLDYGFETNNLPFYVMELVENVQTLLEMAQRPDTFALMCGQMFDALDYLHSQRLVHGDLKPGNVLIASTGDVRLVDFGLSRLAGMVGLMGGTIAYMAPEIVRGAPPSVAGDLYAAGAILYEIVMGEIPFQGDAARILHDVLDIDALMARVQTPALGLLIARLLSKDPADRPPSARAAQRVLAEAFNITMSSMAEVSHGVLHAGFAGRASELSRLMMHIDAAIEGRGAFVAVRGGAGMGKSRLLEELRPRALVRGMTVLAGKTNPEGAAYDLWVDPLRHLLLDTRLSSEDAISIATILPELSPYGFNASTRVNGDDICLAMRVIFGAQKRPILLLLEDLHWATQSLIPLLDLVALCSDLPLLIVGTMRPSDNERLHDLLAHGDLIDLPPLSRTDIESIARALLEDDQRVDALLDDLVLQSEGNPFAVEQLVLSLRAEHTITQFKAQGVEAVIAKRITGLQPADLGVLQLAAMIDRIIDIELMSQAEPAINFRQWLSTCARQGVIEMRGDQWMFVHERMRDAVIALIPSDDLPALAYRAAYILIEVYGEDDRVWVTRLFELWLLAGDREKALSAGECAVESAKRSAAYPDALRLCNRTIALLPQDIARDDARRVRLLQQKADILRELSRNEESAEIADELLLLCPPGSLERMHALSLRSKLMQYSREAREALKYLEEALEISRARDLHTDQALFLSALAVQYARVGEVERGAMIAQEAFVLALPYPSENWAIKVRLDMSIIWRWQGNLQAIYDLYSEMLTHENTLLRRRDLINLYNNFAICCWEMGKLDEALHYSHVGLSMALAIHDQWMIANQRNLIGFIAIDTGAADIALGHFHDALIVACSINAESLLLDILCGVARMRFETGDTAARVEAARLLGLAVGHPASNEDVRVTAQPIIEMVRAALGDSAYEAAASWGARDDLQQVVKEVLARSSDQNAL